MGFMQRYVYNDAYYLVESEHCDCGLVPADLVGENPSLEDFADYVEFRPASFERKEGWFGRYSANGYLDCTDWHWADTREALIEELDAYYGDGDE